MFLGVNVYTMSLTVLDLQRALEDVRNAEHVARTVRDAIAAKMSALGPGGFVIYPPDMYPTVLSYSEDGACKIKEWKVPPSAIIGINEYGSFIVDLKARDNWVREQNAQTPTLSTVDSATV